MPDFCVDVRAMAGDRPMVSREAGWEAELHMSTRLVSSACASWGCRDRGSLGQALPDS